jgi:CRP-like cAMP-binding protein
VSLISEIKFFREKNIKHKDMMDLASAFKFHKEEANSNVFDHGDVGENFYIIIKGIVGVEIPNPKIKDWRMQRVFMFELQ